MRIRCGGKNVNLAVVPQRTMNSGYNKLARPGNLWNIGSLKVATITFLQPLLYVKQLDIQRKA